MSYVNQTLTAIPLGHIISAPMTAAIEAQAIAAQTTVDFIQEVGLQPGATPNDPPTPRMITFSYSKSVGGTVTQGEVTVPFLVVVPIPYLRIDSLDVEFDANIRETKSTYENSSNQLKVGVDVGAQLRFGFQKVDIKASFSYTSLKNKGESSRNSADYLLNIKLHAVQDCMPCGMGKMLNILEGLIVN